MRPTIRSYAEAAKFLATSRQRSTGQRGTVVLRLSPTAIAVRYHNTDVVTYYHPEVGQKVASINTGGWTTDTTLARINEYAPEGVRVMRAEDGKVWVVDDVHDKQQEVTINEPYTVVPAPLSATGTG